MSEEKKGPSHRVSFAAFEQGRKGQNVLGNAREIGAIWPREGKEGEGILRFDHTPREEGVYFVRDLSVAKDKANGEREAPPQRDTDRER